jgi:hypothetical protein
LQRVWFSVRAKSQYGVSLFEVAIASLRHFKVSQKTKSFQFSQAHPFGLKFLHPHTSPLGRRIGYTYAQTFIWEADYHY